MKFAINVHENPDVVILTGFYSILPIIQLDILDSPSWIKQFSKSDIELAINDPENPE